MGSFCTFKEATQPTFKTKSINKIKQNKTKNV